MDIELLQEICRDLVILSKRFKKEKIDLVLAERLRSRLTQGLSIVQSHFDDLNDEANLAAMERVLSSERPNASIKSLGVPRLKIDEEKEVVGIMKQLRRKKATYKEVAEFLNDKNIPTFSGKGKWHAQTIHRLCSTK